MNSCLNKLGTTMREAWLNNSNDSIPDIDKIIVKRVIEEDNPREISLLQEIETAISEISKPTKNGEKSVGLPGDILRNIIVHSWYRLSSICDFYCGLFIPVTQDRDFKNSIYGIWDLLIRKAIMGEIYLAYGQDLLNLDIQIGSQKNLDWNDVRGFCKFRLYTKSSKEDSYYSVLAQEVINPEVAKKLNIKMRVVKFSISSSNYFIQWFWIISETIGAFERVKNLSNFAGIRTIATCDSTEGQTSLESELKTAANGIYPVLQKKGGVNTIVKEGILCTNEYKPHEFVPINLPKELFEFYQSFFDLYTDQLGYSGKSSPHKKERLTKQESKQGTSILSSVQFFMSKRLTTCFNACRYRFYNQKVEGLNDKGELIINNIYNVIPEDLEISVNARQTWDTIVSDNYFNSYLKGEQDLGYKDWAFRNEKFDFGKSKSSEGHS